MIRVDVDCHPLIIRTARDHSDFDFASSPIHLLQAMEAASSAVSASPLAKATPTEPLSSALWIPTAHTAQRPASACLRRLPPTACSPPRRLPVSRTTSLPPCTRKATSHPGICGPWTRTAAAPTISCRQSSTGSSAQRGIASNADD